MRNMIITTARLKLTTSTIDDAEKIFSLTSNANIAEFMRFDTHTDISQAQEYLRNYIDNENVHAFTVHRIFDGEFIGFYALKNEDDLENEYDQTVFIDEKYWGNGYNQEILKSMIEFAKTELNAVSLTAHIVAVNNSSITCIEKFNFKLIKALTFDDYPHPLNIYRLEL